MLKQYSLPVALTIFITLLFMALWQSQQTVPEVRGKVIPPQQTTNEHQAQAQKIALANFPDITDKIELFGVRQVWLPNGKCAKTAVCYQAEYYNYDQNETILHIIDLETETILQTLHQPTVHPGIPPHLASLAFNIASHAPEVIDALGFQPTESTMSPVDADLHESSCNGENLCVGVTFIQDSQVLWAIVDLTQQKLAGTAWTNIVPESPVASQSFQPPAGCPAGGNIDQQGWQLNYQVTGTDGLMVTNATYSNTLAFTSAKLVEWHVDYGNTGFRDVTGCGGGGGFPIYPYGETKMAFLLDIDSQVTGFEIVQDFRMTQWGQNCNYRYEQRYQFYEDGRFHILSGAYGRGCGTEALYRPIIRLDIAAGGDDAGDSFAYWDGTQWLAESHETYRVPYDEVGHGPHTATEQINWRVTDNNGLGYLIEPTTDKFTDSETGNPILYITQHKVEEGDSDLGVIGSCCEDNHQHGPDKYIYGTTANPQTPEPITNENIVLWYMPQLQTMATDDSYSCWTATGEPNPETYPCVAGALFHPIAPTPEAQFSYQTSMTTSVQFYDMSTGLRPFTHTWQFEIGITSTLTNPVHIFPDNGEHLVQLTVQNPLGTDNMSRTIQIQPYYYGYLPVIKRP